MEREEGAPEGAHPEDEEAGARAAAAGPPPLTEEEETFRLRESEEEPEPAMAAAKAALPKPSILFTSPAKRFPWPWIIGIASCLLGGVLVGAVIMWFGGYGWMAKHLKVKGQAPAPAAKVTETSKVEIVPPPPAPPAAPGDLKDLELSNQEERYRGLVNAKGGQLLLIQGKVKNSSSQPRGPIKIKAILTDPQQKAVKEREFYAGTVVFDDELQTLDPEEINRWLDTPGGRAQKQILDPGESQSFMVVFFGAPQKLSGYGYKMQVVKGAVASSQSRRK
ncbi:MAG: DUF3426 domain-containing protein [Deltaproteobacteria bacterium]|nr:DUF3426 domain-containing protein [Deltaproteobacteria bacterium]